ncbi:hypothetical protein F5Y18DRAFT_20876 [Xylariaceae sp. FL1019]|nr:hypothetical protein F5Y18DRAFT_20876 [Xylariaceae sp. FL1019]
MPVRHASLRWAQSYRGSGLIRRPESTRDAPTWPRRWLTSTSATAKPSPSQSPAIDKNDDEYIEVRSNVVSQPFPAIARLRKSAIPLKHQLKPSKQAAKAHLKSSNTTQRALIKQPVDYTNPYARKQSYRKHDNSMGNQAWLAAVRQAGTKSTTPMPTWQETLDFMRRHTPMYGESLDLKIEVGRDSADHARQTLSQLDTSLGQIQRRHQCRVSIHSGRTADEHLVFSLCGPTVSVRKALLEVVGAVGKVSAIKVYEKDLELSPDDLPKALREGPNPVTIYNDWGEIRDPGVSDDQVIKIFNYNRRSTLPVEPIPMQGPYSLTMRADDIPLPTEWSRLEFICYAKKLVYGKVPRHLHPSLYPAGPDHDETVAQLLAKLFDTDDLRPHMTTAALKIALGFLTSQGPRFRPEVRAVWGQAIKLNLQLDGPVFHHFVRAASTAGDLEGFNDVLREIVRSGHYMQPGTWKAFLLMVHDPKAKYQILSKWKSMGVSHVQEGYLEMARQTILLECQALQNSGISAKQFLEKQDRAYGPQWLDTMTANQILYILGSKGNQQGCYQVLNAMADGSRNGAEPDSHTLSTMLTHQRTILGRIAVVERFSTVTPDEVAYRQLFQAPYHRGLPNMTKVLWRYAVFSGSASPSMIHSLAKVMRNDADGGQPEGVLRGQSKVILQSFSDTIFGRDELAASRLTPDAGPRWLMNKYFLDAGSKRPSVPLATKLREAYDMDMKIRALVKEGQEITPEMREDFTIDIPMATPSQTDEDIREFAGVRRITV